MRKSLTTIAALFVFVITFNLNAQTCQVCRTEYGGGGRWQKNTVYCAPADYGEPGYTSCEAHNAPVGPSRCFLYDDSCVGEPGPPFSAARSYEPVQIASLDGEMAAAYVRADATEEAVVPVEPTLAEKVRAGKPPTDIAAITKLFDQLVAEIGRAETIKGVQTANELTGVEMAQLMSWMTDARKIAKAEELRSHHITCMRSLRGCDDEFEKTGADRPGAVRP